MVLYKGLIFTLFTPYTPLLMKTKTPKGCIVKSILWAVVALSLAANYCMYKDNYMSKKYAPKAADYPVDLVYKMSPDDKERNIALLDFQGSITIFQTSGKNEFSHGEEIRSQKNGELGRYTLSVKIPENKNYVLILVRGTALTHHGDKPSFSL